MIYKLGAFTHIFERNLSEFDRVRIRHSDTDINEKKLNYSYVHTAEQLCAAKAPFLLILVKSKVTHFEARDVIRQTWGQIDSRGILKRVFLLGLPQHGDTSTKEKVDTESSLFGDVVQQNFYDSYYNNTLQTVMGIRWSISYCSKAEFFLFIDDDYLMNPKLLISYLKHNVTQNMYKKFYAGHVLKNSWPRRNQFSKWYISLAVYPYSEFPTYIAGNFYLLSGESIELFYQATRLIDLFIFDDVYVGMLAYHLGIEPIDMTQVHNFGPIYFDKNNIANNVIGSHGFWGRDNENLLHVWNELEDQVKFIPEY